MVKSHLKLIFYTSNFLLSFLSSCYENKSSSTQSEQLRFKVDTAITKKTSKLRPVIAKAADTTHNKQPSLNTINKIKIDTFSTFPVEIEGCACYYSNSQEEFNRDILIYVDDYNNKAFI